ncbi:AI-2E family transporter [Caballeronia sp. AZ10_KS36]|uniref:AI-2E family transporter n=1 Tax=Caballeronia sp. AZ10_KS36 TaxID=2921757 RepID=UPI0020298D90|nr:AI-2E family transporter [Caballeronia sp. AZ10_KS36]
MDSKSVARAALIQSTVYASVISLVVLVVAASDVFLLVFGGLLLAVLLRGVTDWLHRRSGMSDKLSLGVAVLVPLVTGVLMVWLVAPDVGDQANELANRLPSALASVKRELMHYEWASSIWRSTDHLRQLLPDGKSGIQRFFGVFSSTFGALGNAVFILFVGLFLALNPSIYINGFLRLIPKSKRSRTHEVLKATAAALRHWLVAKLTAMAVIGLLTTIGLMLLNIDLALVLGVLAASLSFIPNFGPIASVIPAVLIGLAAGPEKAMYVLLLYAAIQAVESYALTPFLQKRMLEMPPALLEALTE